MAKSKKKDIRSIYDSVKQKELFKKTKENLDYSYEYLVEPQIEGWEQKESMLIGKLDDDLSTKVAKSQVYDPRLATILIERCARVMAQNPSGKTLAMSKDDKGKNMFMNLLVDKWILPNAKSQFDFLIKGRLFDMYSGVYGVMFGLVDYVEKKNYQGPDYYLLPIRDCRPQPGRFSLDDSDRFGVLTWVTLDWLKGRNKDIWKNLDTILTLAKEGESTEKGEKNANERSLIEQERQPNIKADPNNGRIKLYTEYHRDRWVTIAPDFAEELILRDIENPNGDDELPIVAKYCFPLLDSIYGLGEFERGKSLQYALNSLINLYLDGVAMSIFPPIIVNPDSVVPSTILDEPAARWLLTKSDPNAIQQPPRNPGGIQTFQSTYQFMLSAIMNLSGTTDTSIGTNTDITQGKTPQALKMVANRENSRDAWDRFMMEETLEDMMKKFVNIAANRITKPIKLELFKTELDEIQKAYPDVIEMFTSGERGNVKISPEQFNKVKYNYQITSGSTYKADQDKELGNIQQLLEFTIKNYQILQPAFQQKGKTIDISELYTRTLIASGTQDWDKIVTDMPENAQNTMAQGQNIDVMNQPLTPQINQAAQAGQTKQFVDPEVNKFAQKIFGNTQFK